jgi:hypothetical protein
LLPVYSKAKINKEIHAVLATLPPEQQRSVSPRQRSLHKVDSHRQHGELSPSPPPPLALQPSPQGRERRPRLSDHSQGSTVASALQTDRHTGDVVAHAVDALVEMGEHARERRVTHGQFRTGLEHEQHPGPRAPAHTLQYAVRCLEPTGVSHSCN